MPGRFLEIPVFLADYFIMPHPGHKYYTVTFKSRLRVIKVIESSTI